MNFGLVLVLFLALSLIPEESVCLGRKRGHNRLIKIRSLEGNYIVNDMVNAPCFCIFSADVTELS